jgi:zinc protease
MSMPPCACQNKIGYTARCLRKRSRDCVREHSRPSLSISLRLTPRLAQPTLGTHLAQGSTDKKSLVLRRNRQAKARTAKLRLLAEFAFGDGGQSVTRYALGNGLTILLLVDKKAPVLSYHTWYRVGSKHETPGKTGLAHLFEHLMFNETKHVPRGHLDRLIESAGGETNAATWVDWTHYQSELPASELPLIVRLEADRMQHLVLRKPQVESEKEVVANERRYRVDDDIEGQVSELLYATVFKRHPYRWPTIGWMEDIQGFTPEDCAQFYRTYYAPNNATLVVTGDFDEEEVLTLVQKHYGKIPAARIPKFKLTPEPPQRSERSLELQRPTPAAKLAIAYRGPSFGDRDYPALALASEVLFGGRSSRLYSRMVRDEEIATDLHGSLAPFSDAGLYEIWVSLRPGRELHEALKVLDEELARICKRGVTDAELQKVKNRMELGFLQGMETAAGKAEQLGFFEVVYGDAQALFGRLETLRTITTDDVKRVANKYFDSRRRTRVAVLPQDSKPAPKERKGRGKRRGEAASASEEGAAA